MIIFNKKRKLPPISGDILPSVAFAQSSMSGVKVTGPDSKIDFKKY